MVAIDNVVTVWYFFTAPPPQKLKRRRRLHKMVYLSCCWEIFRKSSVTSIDYHNGSYSGSMVMAAALFSLPSTSKSWVFFALLLLLLMKILHTLLSRDPLLVYFFTQLLKRCKSIFWLWRKRCSFIFRHVGDLNARSAYSVSSVVIEAFVDSRGLLESFMQTLSIIYAKFEGKTHDGFDPNLPDWF